MCVCVCFLGFGGCFFWGGGGGGGGGGAMELISVCYNSCIRDGQLLFEPMFDWVWCTHWVQE